jgi:hypothetical protein
MIYIGVDLHRPFCYMTRWMQAGRSSGRGGAATTSPACMDILGAGFGPEVAVEACAFWPTFVEAIRSETVCRSARNTSSDEHSGMTRHSQSDHATPHTGESPTFAPPQLWPLGPLRNTNLGTGSRPRTVAPSRSASPPPQQQTVTLRGDRPSVKLRSNLASC